MLTRCRDGDIFWGSGAGNVLFFNALFAAGMDYDDTILQILFFLAPAVQKIVQKENIRENKNLPFVSTLS